MTKSVGVAETAALAALGVTDLGENRPDALLAKRTALADLGLRPSWHMIGHLQTNKLRRALPHLDVLHSLDRTSLLEALAAELARAPRPPLPVFIEVNVSGEASKGGFHPDALRDALERARAIPGLSVTGLMTMAPLSDRAEDARPVFRRLRELRDEVSNRGYLDELGLSMGMSQDFEIAVEEGATHVRVGTILYSG